MAGFNNPADFAISAASQAPRGVEFNWHEPAATYRAPPPRGTHEQPASQSSQQQTDRSLSHTLVYKDLLNRPPIALSRTLTPSETPKYLAGQYNMASTQYRQQNPIENLLEETLCTLKKMSVIHHSVTFDLRLLYRDAFAALSLQTSSKVLVQWAPIVGAQSTIHQNNDAVGVILHIFLTEFGDQQPVFLKNLSHAVQDITIDQFEVAILHWSIAMRNLEHLGIVNMTY